MSIHLTKVFFIYKKKKLEMHTKSNRVTENAEKMRRTDFILLHVHCTLITETGIRPAEMTIGRKLKKECLCHMVLK